MIPIKNPSEIAKMRRAGKLAGSILYALAALIRPGITTGELDRAGGKMIIEAGATSAFLGYRGFPANFCISINEEVVHGIGGRKRINYGDIVKLDCGVNLEGWIGDTASTFPVGIVDPEIERLLAVTEESLYKGISQIKAGMHLGDVSAAIEAHVVQAHFTVVRDFVGHGVGSQLHEEPQIPNFGKKGTGPVLKPGMILAIEPMVNLGTAHVRVLDDGWTVVTEDGAPSAHFEHTVLVTAEGYEILTLCAK